MYITYVLSSKLKALYVLVIIVIYSVLASYSPAMAKEPEYYTEGYYQYTIDGETVHIHSYFGDEESAVIPETIADKKVTEIDDYAFCSGSSVQSITIPEYVVTIKEQAFTGMSSLKKIINRSEKLSIPELEGVSIENDFPRYVDIEEPEKTTKPKNTIKPQNDPEHQDNAIQYDSDVIDEYKGITADNEKAVIVPDETGNLIKISNEGEVTVLDKTDKYFLATDNEGKTIITNSKNEAITVDADGNVKNEQTNEIIYSGKATDGRDESKLSDGSGNDGSGNDGSGNDDSGNDDSGSEVSGNDNSGNDDSEAPESDEISEDDESNGANVPMIVILCTAAAIIILVIILVRKKKWRKK